MEKTAKQIISRQIESEYNQAAAIYCDMLSKLFDRVSSYNYYKDFRIKIDTLEADTYSFYIVQKGTQEHIQTNFVLGFEHIEMLSFAKEPTENDLSELLAEIPKLKRFYNFLGIIDKWPFMKVKTTFENQRFVDWLQARAFKPKNQELNFDKVI